ncbi:MAG: hypothetical protein EOM87_03190 [Clostridia bacterium]|nr:hypothetical protein [Clostridia bacterium]
MFFTGFTSIDEYLLDESNIPVNNDLVLPDSVDLIEASEHGYIGRVQSEEEDLYTFVFKNNDGTNTMRVYSHPVKYIDCKGIIKDITLDLNALSNGNYQTANNNIKTTFSKQLSEGIFLEYNDIVISMIPKLKTTNNSEASLSSDKKKVTYLYGDKTTLEYSLTYMGFKEDIVISEYTGQNDFSFTLITNGLTLVEENGSYYLTDTKGNIKATIGDIIVFTADEHNNTMGYMTYETINANKEYELSIHIDEDFLCDKSTLYPIRIDPTIEINSSSGSGAIEDVTINPNYVFSGTSSSIHVGRQPAGSITRTLMRFPNLSLIKYSGNNIPLAYVEIRDLMCQGDEDITVYCHTYNSSSPTWSESGNTSWASVGSAYIGTTLDYNLISYGEGIGTGSGESHRYRFNITNLAQKWANEKEVRQRE